MSERRYSPEAVVLAFIVGVIFGIVFTVVGAIVALHWIGEM